MTKQNQNTKLPMADCHFHIVDPLRFTLAKGMGYQPRPEECGSFADFSACMQSHGISHGLAVQPSGYGYDNAALLDGIRQSQGRLKGIAVAPPASTVDDLHELKKAGVVGLRFNLVDFNPASLNEDGAGSLLEIIRELDWFAEIQCRAADVISIEPLLRRSGAKILIDYLGRPDPGLGTAEIGFKSVLTMADTGRAAVKLSGAFRESRQDHPFADLDPFVEALLNAYTPANCIWGSDWPFLNIDPKPEYRQTLVCLERWLPDENDRRKVLWDTPARLFGFGPK